MDTDNMTRDERFAEMQRQMSETINDLEGKIREYGSFNVIANSFARTQIEQRRAQSGRGPEPSAVNTEYLALICLKFPFSLGYREFSQAREVAKDLYEIEEMATRVMLLYSILHKEKFWKGKNPDEHFGFEHFSEALSLEELLVRNETFDEHHWDLVEGLYLPYDEYFKEQFGFSVKEAIALCLTIADYSADVILEGGKEIHASVDELYEDAIAYKYKNREPKLPYPQDFLEFYKKADDAVIKREIQRSMMTYEMVMLGHRISFTVQDLAAMEPINVATIEKFLNRLSIGFGGINPDFSAPEIMHPLKDRPVIRHEGRYICPSLSLLDYSLDRIFAETLLKDSKKREKYKSWRHEYLMATGIECLQKVLKAKIYHTNLVYDGGEMDGYIEIDGNALFIEGKSHRITDRAKGGYIARLETHVDQIVLASHSQARKAYKYLFGKSAAEFRDKNGKKVVLDGSRIKKAFFVCLTLETMRPIATNLKVGSPLGEFGLETFPWLICLYDLRIVCEHMEGPAYLLHYLQRRSQFFTHIKFRIRDELDLLGYYLKRNLRFDDIPKEEYEAKRVINLPTMADDFNRYYLALQDETRRSVKKIIHYAQWPAKQLILILEGSNLPNSINAAIQILEMGEKNRTVLVNSIKAVRKKYKKDGRVHDFRCSGDNWEGVTWMFSYWIAPNTEEYRRYFTQFVLEKYKEEPHNRYVAIFDSGKDGYQMQEIVYLTA